MEKERSGSDGAYYLVRFNLKSVMTVEAAGMCQRAKAFNTDCKGQRRLTRKRQKKASDNVNNRGRRYKTRLQGFLYSSYSLPGNDVVT